MSDEPEPTGAELPLVLIVDDDDDARVIHTEILRRRGFWTAEADNGATAIALALSSRPDVILMDCSMPGMSGSEAAERLKHDPRTWEIPIVMLSGFGSPGAATPGSPSTGRCDAYLQKPCAADELAAALRALLAVRRPKEKRRASALHC